MSRMAEQQLYINGGYTSATSGRTFETINPATPSSFPPSLQSFLSLPPGTLDRERKRERESQQLP